MQYNKYVQNGYNLHIIKTNKFKTINIKVNFKNLAKKETITVRNLISKVLMESNQDYKSNREIEIECEELYNLSMGGNSLLSGKCQTICFTTSFLNEKYTEEGMNRKSIAFFLNFLLKPNLENKGLAYFELVKRSLKDEIKSQIEDPRGYSLVRTFEEMDKKRYLNPKGYLEDLEKITNEELYENYKKMINDDVVDIFVIGDVDNDDIIKQIDQLFPKRKDEKRELTHYIEHESFRDEYKIVKESLPLEQATLRMGFKLEHLTPFEREYVLAIYVSILGGNPNSKLFANVREKNSLCYTISCSDNSLFGAIMISAGINLSDFEKCLLLIQKEVNNMAEGLFEETDIEAAKTIYINDLKSKEDSPFSIIKSYESHEYLKTDFLEKRSHEIIKVNKDDIKNLSKKIIIDTVYILGGFDEEI